MSFYYITNKNSRSSSVSLASADEFFPMVLSNSAFFFSCSSMIRDSTESWITSRVSLIGRYCPSRWMRSMAYSKTRGYLVFSRRIPPSVSLKDYQGSQTKTLLASVRFSANPPAFRLIRNTVMSCWVENLLVRTISTL